MTRWSHRKLATTTRFVLHNALRRLLRHLAVAGARPGLDQLVPRIPKPGPRQVTATAEQRAALLAGARPPLRLLILLCSDLALRSGTAIKVAPCHWNRERDELQLRTKFGRTQTLPLTDQVRQLLELAPTHEPDSTTPFVALLAGERGVSHANLHRQFIDLRRGLGLQHLWLHDLRRTTARAVLDTTGDLRLVQTLLGHHQLASTFHYLDGTDKRLDAAVLEAAKLKPTK